MPKRIAPRLASGERRETFGHGLPPHILEGLRAIAYMENESLSWVLEQMITDWCKTRVEYIKPKNKGNAK